MTITAFRHLRAFMWLGLMLVALLVLAGCGRKDKEEAVKAPAATAPALWRISDEDGAIYLYGTFHLLPSAVDWQTETMRAAFDGADLLILEADVAGAAPADVVALISQYALAKPGPTLRSRLSPEAQTKFEALAGKLGLSGEQLDGFAPWYAATVLSLKFAESQGLSAAQGVEQQLVQSAGTEDKPIAYLETIEEQIRFFAELPEATQLKMLEATLTELETADTVLNDMQAAWLRGDTDSMSSLFDKSIRDIPELYDVLIKRRNERWASEIAKLTYSGGNIFIAVGAGHLVGNDSVIALLESQGFKVERL